MLKRAAQIRAGKDIVAKELDNLRCSVAWGVTGSSAEVERSMEAYPFVAHARNSEGDLVGYVSAFSDGVFTTMLGELLVHPDYQRRGIGSALLKQVEQRYPGIPVEVRCSGEQLAFFLRRGFLSRGRRVQLVSKMSDARNESVIAWTAGSLRADY